MICVSNISQGGWKQIFTPEEGRTYLNMYEIDFSSLNK